MKVNELSIGDWVQLWGFPAYSDKEESEEYVVAYVHESGTVMLTDGDGDIPCRIDEVSPIPLTKDFFEKNGFKIIENDIVDEAYILDEDEDEENYDLIIREFDFNESYVVCTTRDNTSLFAIAYVHELQHLLRLLGIDKKIIVQK